MYSERLLKKKLVRFQAWKIVLLCLYCLFDSGCGAIWGSVTWNQGGIFAVTSDWNSGTLSLFSLSEPGGTLSFSGSVSAGPNPNVMGVGPNGQFIFVPQSPLNGSIVGYQIEATSNALIPVPGSPFSGPGGAGQMALFHPSGKFLYVSFTTPDVVCAYSVNGSGTLTLISACYPTGASGSYFLAVDPFGRFLYLTNFSSDNITGWSINPSTGALTSLGIVATVGSSPISIAVDRTGTVLFIAEGTSVIDYTINQSLGTLTLANGPYVCCGSTEWISVDPQNKYLLVASNVAPKGIFSYSFTAGGALTLVSGPITGTGTSYMTAVFDPSETVVYSSSSLSNIMNVFPFNSSTGSLGVPQTLTSPSASYSISTFITNYH